MCVGTDHGNVTGAARGVRSGLGFLSLNRMLGAAVAGRNRHWFTVGRTQGLEFVHKLLLHLVLAAVRAVELVSLKVWYERPIHANPRLLPTPARHAV